MFGALRRNGVAHALRISSPRCLSARPITQRPQWHRPALAAVLNGSRSYISSPAKFSAAAPAQQVEADLPVQEEATGKFADLAEQGLVHPRIIRTITGEKNITTMTDVQAMTIHDTLTGVDVLAQAKTGTGKTIAFLLPVLQNILKDETVKLRSRNSRSTPVDIRGIIISPTRELAEQIAKEARQLAYGTGVVVQTAVGGTRKREGLQQIRREGCHLLIGTPGRLKDLLSDPYSGVAAPKLSTFVLDEADRLLDDGFAPDILELQNMLPNPAKVDRQTLLFSATVPKEVMSMVRRTMKPDYKFIRTVNENEVPTHLKVPQKAVIIDGYQNVLPALLELAKNYASQPINDERPFKAIVYYNSTKQVRIGFEVFLGLLTGPGSPLRAHGLPIRVSELHSRLSQASRTRTAEFFRKSRSAILFSSDVTARGMDFPGVTHVVQVGLPRDRPTYIHRLGRTGRANQTGEGWIFLHKGELGVSKKRLAELPIEVDTESLSMATVNMRESDANDSEEMIRQINNVMETIPDEAKAEAYLAQLTSSVGLFDRDHVMVQALNDLALHGYGLPEPPKIPGSVAQRMGLSRIRGLNIDRSGRPRRDNDEAPSRGYRDERPSRGFRGERSFGRSRDDRPSGRYRDERSSGRYRERNSRSSSRRNDDDDFF